MKLVAGERFILQNENEFAKLTRGKLEVYAVTRNEKSFRQIFLTEINEGDAAFPSMDEFGYVDISLYAVQDSDVEIDDRKNSTPADMTALMTNWFANLVEISWLRLLADRGDDILRSWQDKKVFIVDSLPLSEIEFIFREHELTLATLLGIYFRAEDKKLSRRLEVRESHKQKLIEETVASLIGEEIFLREDTENRNVKFNEAAFIVRRIAKALSMPADNIKLAPEIIGKLDRFGLIRRLFQKGNMQIRLVKLKDDWYKQDCGVLLGYYGEKKNLAAIIPKTPTNYILVTRDFPEGINVDEKVAAEIDEDAFSCYAGLPTKKLKPLDVLKFMFRHSWKADWKAIIAASFIAGLIPLVTPIITETIFADIIPILDRQGLATVVQVMLITGFTTSAVGIVRSIAVTRFVTNIDLATESALFGRLLSLPTKFFRRFQTGELVSRISGMESIVTAISGDIFAQIFNFLFSFWSLFLMFWYSLPLTLLAVTISVTWTIISFALIHHSVKLRRELTQAHNKTAGIVQQIFTGLAKFRVQGNEEQAYHLWAKNFVNEWNWNWKIRWQGNYTSLLGMIQSTACILLMYFVVMHYVNELDADGKIVKEGINYATFLAFQAAYGGFNGTLNAFLGAVGGFLAIQPQVENVKPLFEEEPEILDDKPDADILSGAIEVKDLTFAYDEDSPDVLHGISFRVKSKENVAIVGKSGCGKSTLVRLLLGFEKPNKGAIYYDGQDLSEVNLASVRSQMGVVLQNGQLMSGDIFTNIVGTSNLTQDDAWAAAEAAGVADDIRQMPMGMQTIISEGSTNISGGQRQRILIARALAARPSIIIFDEATSALDNRTQAIVTESLDKMRATRIVIAHRLSTIRGCDKIIVMDRGRIVEQGGFDELVAKGGLFADLVKRQI